jgi:hypothetical protein
MSISSQVPKGGDATIRAGESRVFDGSMLEKPFPQKAFRGKGFEKLLTPSMGAIDPDGSWAGSRYWEINDGDSTTSLPTNAFPSEKGTRFFPFLHFPEAVKPSKIELDWGLAPSEPFFVLQSCPSFPEIWTVGWHNVVSLAGHDGDIPESLRVAAKCWRIGVLASPTKDFALAEMRLFGTGRTRSVWQAAGIETDIRIRESSSEGGGIEVINLTEYDFQVRLLF